MKGVFTLLLFLLVGILALAYTFGYVVPPGGMGVRQTKFGPGQGFSKSGLPPGYHWSVPFYTTVHLVPTTLQLLHFTREEERTKESVFPSLEVQTSDRQTVDVDVTVVYRFLRQAAKDEQSGVQYGGPRDLFSLGTSRYSWVNEVRARAEDQVKRHLGQLSTSEFYNPHFREEKIRAALDVINQRVASKGIHVEALLLRRYTYRAPEIDNAIFQKNLQEQEQSLNITASRLAEAQAELERVAAEWDAKIETLRVSGENDARVVRSKGDLFEAQRKAEGDLLVAKARAEVDRLKAAALAQSVGANIFVARELAPLLQTLKGGVVSDIDPYNLSEWTRRLGVQENQR